MSHTNRTLVLQLVHQMGSLKEALSVFQKHNVNLQKIESKASNVKFTQYLRSAVSNRVYDFVLEIASDTASNNLEQAIEDLLRLKVCVGVTRIGASNGICIELMY